MLPATETLPATLDLFDDGAPVTKSKPARITETRTVSMMVADSKGDRNARCMTRTSSAFRFARKHAKVAGSVNRVLKKSLFGTANAV